MKRTRKRWLVLAFATALVASVGCSGDDDPTDIPVDQVVEAGLDQAITTTVVPVVQFMRAMRQIVVPSSAVFGDVCPDTSSWCSSGTAACSVASNGLDFVFDHCVYVNGDEPLTLHGSVHANVACCTTVSLHLTNISINDSPPNNGDGAIDVNACRYGIEIGNSDADIAGAIVQCDKDTYPSGESVAIYLADYTVNVTLNGTNSAPAVATQAGNAAIVVANCTINLDTFTSACEVP